MRCCLFAGFLLLWSLLAWSAPDCRKVSDVCVAPGQTRQISGMSVYRDCWEYRATYECRSPHTINDCQALRDKGCASIGARCIERANDGRRVPSKRSNVLISPKKSHNAQSVIRNRFARMGQSVSIPNPHPIRILLTRR